VIQRPTQVPAANSPREDIHDRKDGRYWSCAAFSRAADR
jgi:hypothetical protein